MSNLPMQSQVLQNDQLSSASNITQEELEFNEQFRKWEEEFDNWKKANANHPDKTAYKQYEQQFESVRQKLLQVNLIECLNDLHT